MLRGSVAIPRGRALRLSGLVLLVVVVLLVVAQLLLPQLAARAVRDRVGRYGSVRSTSVHAMPAVELLWGQADATTVDARHLSISPSEIVALLLEASGFHSVRVHAQSVALEGVQLARAPVRLQDVTLSKKGEQVRGAAMVSRQALAAALPAGMRVVILGSDASGVRVRVTGNLFGFQASLEALVEPVEGKLELVPSGALLGGLARVTIFDQPRLRILSVAATPRADGGWELSASALLH